MHWTVYALFSAIFAALVAIFGKLGMKGLDSTLATTLRGVIMAVFLLVVSFVLGKFKGLAQVDRRMLIYIVLAGIAGALSWIAYFTALQKGPARGVSALDRTSVAMVVVLAALFLGEALTWKAALGALLIVGGAVLMVL